MPEKESYLQKHHWGIAQTLLALYCAGFATWEHFHPKVATPADPRSSKPDLPGAIVSTSYAMPIWLWLGIIALALSVLVPALFKMFKRRSLRQSRLTIHSANYRAYVDGGKTYDVRDFLQKMIQGDSLTLEIENHNFLVDGKNYVPKDPFSGQEKRLHVTYEFDGNPPITIQRPEHERIVLPEDSFLIGLLETCQREKSLNALSAHVPYSVSDSDPLVYPEFTDARWSTASENKENQAYFTLVNRGGAEASNIIVEPIEMHDKIIQFYRHRMAAPLLPKREAYFYPDVVTKDNRSVAEQAKDLFSLFCLDYLDLGDSTISEATKVVTATYQDSARNLFEVTCELVFDPSAHAGVRIGQRGLSPVICTRNHKFRKVAKAALSPDEENKK